MDGLDANREAKEFLGDKTPIEKFSEWFAEAQAASAKYPEAFKMPEAFVLSTGYKKMVSSRVLLMKEVRPEGLVFFSNYLSLKGQQILSNPIVALNFYWSPLFRQVNFRGVVKRVSKTESLNYWRTRPRESQISQYVSKQSQPVKSRAQLDQEWQAANAKFAGQEIPLPKNWGGYFFTPTFIEFWIGRDGRFHDRYVFTKARGRWTSERYYP